MPTTFAITDSHVVLGGEWDSAGTVATVSPTLQFSSHGAQFDTVVTGTACTLRLYAQTGNNVQVTIDGSTPFNLSLTTGSFQTYTLFTGLTDAAHTVSVKSTVGLGGGAPVLDANNALVVTGSAPALGLPSGFSSNSVLQVGNTAYLQNDGSQGPSATVEGNSNALGGSSAGGAHDGHGYVRFNATLTNTGTVNVWVYCGGDKYALIIDDNIASATSVTAPNLNNWGWITFTGLSTGTQHQYMVLSSKPGGAGSCYVASIGIDGTFNTLTPTARKLWLWLGDSIVVNTSTDFVQGFIELFSVNTQRAYYVCGIAGNCVSTSSTGSGTALESRIASEIAAMSVAPTDVAILEGVNDANDGTAAATFQKSYFNAVKAAVTALPSTNFHCCIFLETTNPTASGLRSAYATAIQNAIGAVGDGTGNVLTTAQQAQCSFVDTTGFFDPVHNSVGDGLHPNVTGESQIATAFEGVFPNGFAVVMDTGVWLESLAAIFRDTSPPTESVAALHADSAPPLESLATVRRDSPASIDSVGQVVVTMDSAIPIESVSSVRSDAGPSLDSLISVRRDVPADVESLATVRMDSPASVDSTGAITVTMSSAFAIESVASVRVDWEALAESLISAQADVPPEAESLGSLRVDVHASVDSTGTAIVAASTLMEAIRTRLLSVSALEGLTDVYNRRPKSGATFPYLVVSMITSTQELNTGPDYQDIPQLQFSVLANSDVQAESLGVAAFDALMPSQSNPPLEWTDGAETIRLPMFKDRLMLMPGLDKNNQPVWSYVFGYQILTVRNR